MFRPTLYMTGRNLVIGIVLVLLWDRFLNPSNLSPLGHAGFCVGAVAGMLAWFEYLHLDGFAVHHLNENIRKKPKERHRSKDIVDFVDEKIISYDELEKDEKAVCRFLSDLICAAVFMISGIFTAIFC